MKDTKLKIASILVIINLVFSIAGLIIQYNLSSDVQSHFSLGTVITKSLPMFVAILILAVGFMIGNKYVVCASYLIQAVFPFIEGIAHFFGFFSNGHSITSIEFYVFISNFANVFMNLAMLIFVFTVFESKINKINKKTTSSKFNDTDALQESKKLLELGLITQEEFDAKKKEILGF